MTAPRSALDSATRVKVAEAAMDTVLNGARALPPEQRGEYLTTCATIAISLMHGMLGKKFTGGYLAAAVDSLDDPTTIVMVEPTHQ